jgi:5-oxoprolinase (ATP-hydrolysing)
LSSIPVSQDPSNYQDAPTEGIRRVLEHVMGERIPRGTVLNTDKIGE